METTKQQADKIMEMNRTIIILNLSKGLNQSTNKHFKENINSLRKCVHLVHLRIVQQNDS